MAFNRNLKTLINVTKWCSWIEKKNQHSWYCCKFWNEEKSRGLRWGCHECGCADWHRGCGAGSVCALPQPPHRKLSCFSSPCVSRLLRLPLPSTYLLVVLMVLVLGEYKELLNDKEMTPVLSVGTHQTQPELGARMCGHSRCSQATIAREILPASSFINFLSALGTSLRRAAGAEVPNELMTHVTLAGIETENEKEQDEALDTAVAVLLVCLMWDSRAVGPQGTVVIIRLHLPPSAGTEPLRIHVCAKVGAGNGPEPVERAPLGVLAFVCVCALCICTHGILWFYVYTCMYIHTHIYVHVCGRCICAIVCPESFCQAGVQPIWSTLPCSANDETYLCKSFSWIALKILHICL